MAHAEELTIAFTVFLQEGYRYGPHGAAPSPTALQAIAASSFEIIYRQIRGDGTEPQISVLLPHATFLCLAPFLGAVQANRFLDEQLGLTDRSR